MMSTRLAILELTARHRLDAPTLHALWRLARLGAPPQDLPALLRRGLGALAALLGGLGVVFLVAANLDALGRREKFILLQLLAGAACVGAAALPRLRMPLALLGFLAIGGLFAYFGQTYQTGADPWQLFALWAALGLPLALGTRSDAVWCAWVIVASTALAAWDAAQSGRWSVSADDLSVHLLAALMAAALAVLMGQPLARFSGAGKWAFNLATLLATLSVAGVGMMSLFAWNGNWLFYPLALCVLGLGAAFLCQRRYFDVTALSVMALGLISLVATGIGRAVLRGGDEKAGLLLLGVAAVALLALAVWGILALLREYSLQDGQGDVA